MTASDLQRLLLERYPVENERHEWKEWQSLKSSVSGRKGEDLISCVSALANMDGGVVVIGAKDRTLVPTGIEDFADYSAENLPHRLLGRCPNLSSLGLRVEALSTSDTDRTVWLVHVPRHLPRKPVYAHDKAWQRDGDSLVGLRDERLNAILAEPLAGEDWSAAPVAGARIDDLDPAALARAREQFAMKHSRERWAAEVPQWSDVQLLDKAKLTVHGSITRAALLLLGRPESARLLSPHPAEITWRLSDERVVEHFGPPFMLTTTEVLRRIRNPNIKLFPATELIATELPRYEVKVILEALHNCVAHQDYARGARIVVEEAPGRLRFTNAGAFFDGRPEDYFAGQRTPQVYRNHWLASAMDNIGMIDKAGFGIRDMVGTQRRRFLPLPDYAGSTLDSTVFNVFGQTLDENYSRLLMTRTELSVEQVVWLDRIQKRMPIADAHAAALRQAGLIEGRKPNWHVSAKVADLTNRRAEYMRTRGLDDRALKALVIDYVRKFESVAGTELRRFVLGKLPEVLTETQKLHKVRNLLTALRKRGVDGWRIEADRRGQGARWTLRKN